MKNVLMISLVLAICCGTVFASDANTIEPAKVSWENLSKETVTELISWVRSAKDFAEEQAPLVCQEVLTWGKVSSISGMCIGSFFLITGIILFLNGMIGMIGLVFPLWVGVGLVL